MTVGRLPVWLRSVVAGLLIAALGALSWSAIAEFNLRSGDWPWAAVVELPVLALMVWWLGGGGPPKATAEERRRRLRARPVTGAAFRWSLFAGLSYAVTLFAITIVGWQLSAPSPAALAELDQLTQLPRTTVVPILLVGSVVAGVVEESAFRGYMQQPLETRYGAPVAIGVVAFVFAVAHFPGPVVLPFFALAAAGWGILAYATGSILIGTLFHVLVDAAGWLWLVIASESARGLMGAGVADGNASVTLTLWVAGLILSAVLTVWSMSRLAALPRLHRPPSKPNAS